MTPFSISDQEKITLFTTALKTTLNIDLVLNLSFDEPRTIDLERIMVPSSLQNTGIGTKAMQALVLFAEAENYSVELIPIGIGNNNDAATAARLREFYSRFGFVDSHMGTMRLEAKNPHTYMSTFVDTKQSPPHVV